MKRAALIVTENEDGTLSITAEFHPKIVAGEPLSLAHRLVADAQGYLVRVYSEEDELESIKVDGREILNKRK